MTIEEHIIANDVLRNVMDKFKNQQVKGLAKYGETVNPESYSVVGWLNHIQQEMIDAAVYAEVLINVTSKIVEENKRVREALELYADEKRWTEPHTYTTLVDGEPDAVKDAPWAILDCGEFARKTLEESK